jgi:hypothetical protein
MVHAGVEKLEGSREGASERGGRRERPWVVGVARDMIERPGGGRWEVVAGPGWGQPDAH